MGWADQKRQSYRQATPYDQAFSQPGITQQHEERLDQSAYQMRSAEKQAELGVSQPKIIADDRQSSPLRYRKSIRRRIR